MSQPADLDAFTDSSTSGAPRHGFQGDRGKPPAVRRAPLGLTIAVSREAGARGASIARRVGGKWLSVRLRNRHRPARMLCGEPCQSWHG